MAERIVSAVGKLCFALLILVVTPVVFDVVRWRHVSAPELVALAFAAVAGARLLWLVMSDQPKFLDISFWVFVFTFFGVAAAKQIRAAQFPLFHTMPYDEDVILSTQLRIAVGIAAYVLGRSLFRRPRRRSDKAPRPEVRVSEARVWLLGVFGTAVALALILHLGIKPFFASRAIRELAIYGSKGVQGFRVYELQSKGLGNVLQLALTVPVFVALLYLIATGRWRRHLVLVSSLVVVNVVVNNPVSNARYWTSIVIVGLLAAFFRLNGKGRTVFFALALLVSILYGYSYLNVFRTPGYHETALSPPAELVKSAPDYAMFQQEINATLFTRAHGYTSGRQVGGALLVYLPRSVWADKPGDTGDLVGKEAGFNVASSLWTEFFIDFGYPELVLMFTALGALYALLDSYFADSDSVAVSVIVPVAATFSVIFLRGSLQPVLASGGPVFLVLLVVLRRTKRRTPVPDDPVLAEMAVR